MNRWPSLEPWECRARWDAAAWRRCGSRRKYPPGPESQLVGTLASESAVARRHSDAVQVAVLQSGHRLVLLCSPVTLFHLSLLGVFSELCLQESAVGDFLCDALDLGVLLSFFRSTVFSGLFSLVGQASYRTMAFRALWSEPEQMWLGYL
jgi:hypothetical protein